MIDRSARAKIKSTCFSNNIGIILFMPLEITLTSAFNNSYIRQKKEFVLLRISFHIIVLNFYTRGNTRPVSVLSTACRQLISLGTYVAAEEDAPRTTREKKEKDERQINRLIVHDGWLSRSRERELIHNEREKELKAYSIFQRMPMRRVTIIIQFSLSKILYARTHVGI